MKKVALNEYGYLSKEEFDKIKHTSVGDIANNRIFTSEEDFKAESFFPNRFKSEYKKGDLFIEENGILHNMSKDDYKYYSKNPGDLYGFFECV